MTDQENQVLIDYALVLGVFGEDSKEAKAICEENATNLDLVEAMIKIVLRYREYLYQKETENDVQAPQG